MRIVEKPLQSDFADEIREGYSDFVLGDVISEASVLSSPWILPSITKKHETTPEITRNLGFRVPDLCISLDTSGSMEHPSRNSAAVRSGFRIAYNYYMNGSRIMLNNFSTDSLVIPFTREIEKIFSGLCAYWGGGTYFSIEKFMTYFDLLSRGIQDPKKYVEGLDEDEKRKFFDKEIAVKI